MSIPKDIAGDELIRLLAHTVMKLLDKREAM